MVDTKVLFHFDAGPQLRAQLRARENQNLTIACCPEGPDQPFFSELAETDVLWHVLHPVTESVMDRAPKLKLIQKIGVGVNTIDLDAAKSRGIRVCNMPGTNSRAVAEMTLLLMLAALRRLPRIDQACRSGQWKTDEATRESLGEISGRTVGFVGFGAVPEALAPVLDAMGARVVYTTPAAKPLPYDYLSLEQLLARSDIVSLHLPLTPDTELMINAARLASMKPGSILINTARGGLVDEHALHAALLSGHLGAAGLDVFSKEPVPADNPLLSLDNVVVAPHLAWLTNETFQRSIDVAISNTRAVMTGAELDHVVV